MALETVVKLESLQVPDKAKQHHVKVKVMKGFLQYSTGSDDSCVATMEAACSALSHNEHGYNNDEAAYLYQYASKIGVWSCEQLGRELGVFSETWKYNIDNVDKGLKETFPQQKTKK